MGSGVPVVCRPCLAVQSLGSLCACILLLPMVGCVGGGDDVSFAATDASSAGPDASSAGDATLTGASSGGAAGDASARDASSPTGDASPGTTVALLRVANWSPDAPAVDFCVAPHGTSVFRGPLLVGIERAEVEAGLAVDSGSGALAFPEVSSYVQVAPGRYDARIVVGRSCGAGIGPDAIALPAVSAGASTTIALVGAESVADGQPGLQIVGFLDDVTIAGAVALRFINAAPMAAPVDVGTGAGASFVPLFAGIPFGEAGSGQEAPARDGSAPAVDARGYLSRSALAGVALGARAHAGATGDAGVPSALASNVWIASGSVVSVIVTGGTESVPLGLLECVDNAGIVGSLSNCTVISGQ
jgi:Domain of unknown function (DUF4397)